MALSPSTTKVEPGERDRAPLLAMSFDAPEICQSVAVCPVEPRCISTAWPCSGIAPGGATRVSLVSARASTVLVGCQEFEQDLPMVLGGDAAECIVECVIGEGEYLRSGVDTPGSR
jgi:hypothetical protein